MNATRKTQLLALWSANPTCRTGSARHGGHRCLPGAGRRRWQDLSGIDVRALGGSEPLLDHSRLFNTGSTTLRLDCPIVRDIIGGFIPGVQDGYLDVINNHGTEQVCAELVAVSQVESATFTVESSGRQCTPLSGFQSQRLSFNNFPVLGNRETEHYYFSVSIPPVDAGRRSGIISYEVDEED